MRISAKADYAVRAMAELAGAELRRSEHWTRASEIATAQGISNHFLHHILAELRRAGLVELRRGPEGGARLARSAKGISIAAVLRAIDGPLETIRDLRPEELTYSGAAAQLPVVWIAARASLRTIFEGVSLADLAAGKFAPLVHELVAEPDAWESR